MNDIPTRNEIWRWNSFISSRPIISRNRPKRSTTKPNAIREILVRFHANNVRSAANRTLGSSRSDMTIRSQVVSAQASLLLGCPLARDFKPPDFPPPSTHPNPAEALPGPTRGRGLSGFCNHTSNAPCPRSSGGISSHGVFGPPCSCAWRCWPSMGSIFGQLLAFLRDCRRLTATAGR